MPATARPGGARKEIPLRIVETEGIECTAVNSIHCFEISEKCV